MLRPQSLKNCRKFPFCSRWGPCAEGELTGHRLVSLASAQSRSQSLAPRGEALIEISSDTRRVPLRRWGSPDRCPPIALPPLGTAPA